MDEVDTVADAVLALPREQCAPLFADQAPVAELLDVLDQRQAAHHSTGI